MVLPILFLRVTPRGSRVMPLKVAYDHILLDLGIIPSLKLRASLHLKMDAWNTIRLPFAMDGIFSG